MRDGLGAEIARAGTRCSRWDGSVDDDTLAPSAEHAVSPTALQTWATCPRKYLLGNVLRVAETEKPEDAPRISPLERGNLMPQALEALLPQAAPRSSPDHPRSEDERDARTETGDRPSRVRAAPGARRPGPRGPRPPPPAGPSVARRAALPGRSWTTHQPRGPR